MSLSIWGSSSGDYAIIGDEDCKEGDPILLVPINQENIIGWIKALLAILEDGSIQDLPGDMGKCSNVEKE